VCGCPRSKEIEVINGINLSVFLVMDKKRIDIFEKLYMAKEEYIWSNISYLSGINDQEWEN
jgi:hypothetical protein